MPAMSCRYMPIMGEFETSPDRIVFKGRPMEVPESAQPNPGAAEDAPQAQTSASVGILLSDHKMINGVLRATVQFAETNLFSVMRHWIPSSPAQPDWRVVKGASHTQLET
jgi:hypothetical protein